MCVSVGQEEEEEEEEEGEGEGEGEEEEEEEEEEEPTEAPSNQTETNANVTWPPVECQIADIEISCRGVGLTQLPFLQYPQATKLDVACVCINKFYKNTFSYRISLKSRQPFTFSAAASSPERL